jgi:hypothetical protein
MIASGSDSQISQVPFDTANRKIQKSYLKENNIEATGIDE